MLVGQFHLLVRQKFVDAALGDVAGYGKCAIGLQANELGVLQVALNVGELAAGSDQAVVPDSRYTSDFLPNGLIAWRIGQ